MTKVTKHNNFIYKLIRIHKAQQYFKKKFNSLYLTLNASLRMTKLNSTFEILNLLVF